MRNNKSHEPSSSTVMHIPNRLAGHCSVVLLLWSLLIVHSFITPPSSYGLESEGKGHPNQTQESRLADSRWSYHGFQGPRFWGLLEATNKECRIGHQQSPIDVAMPHHPEQQEKLEFHYSQSRFTPIATRHGLHFRPLGYSYLQFNNRTYQLQQVHFHDPSEHHIHGKEFPIEMHLVHEDQLGHLLVIGLLFTQGTVNEELTPLLRLGLQAHHAQTVQHRRYDPKVTETSDLNIRHLLPKDLHHFSYQGSLTTPPCTQGVQWIIMRTSAQLSKSQIHKLKVIYGVNARPVQPLYNREVQDY